MKLTNPEKLILLMLCDVHEKLGIADSTTELIKASIDSNQTWALDWELTGVVGDSPEPTPPNVSAVVNYLDMWSFIEEAIEKLSPEEVARLKAAIGHGSISFSGFDGNNEEEFGIANFLVRKMKRFSRFEKRDLNSHSPSVDRYAAMYREFGPIRATLTGRGLSLEELTKVLKARR